jgi:hypothetical protein
MTIGVKSYRRICLPAGTTSFIYAADYVPNVRRLVGIVDEIELLFSKAIHSRAADDPGAGGHRPESGLTYNVHLPVDVSIRHPDRRRHDHDVGFSSIFWNRWRPWPPRRTSTSPGSWDRRMSPQRNGSNGFTEALADMLRMGGTPHGFR